VELCDRLKDQACRCGDTPQPGEKGRPIELEDTDMEEYLSPNVVSRLVPIEEPVAGSSRREIAEDTGACVFILLDGEGSDNSALDVADKMEPIPVPPPVRGQRAVRSLGKIKGPSTARFSGRMSSSRRSSRPFPLGYRVCNADPAHGSVGRSRIREEQVAQRKERLAAFFRDRKKAVVPTDKSESGEELPDYEESEQEGKCTPIKRSSNSPAVFTDRRGREFIRGDSSDVIDAPGFDRPLVIRSWSKVARARANAGGGVHPTPTPSPQRGVHREARGGRRSSSPEV